MNTNQIAEELFSRFGINLPAAASKWVDDYVQAAIEKATAGDYWLNRYKQCAKDFDALRREFDDSRAARESEERLACRELAHREYHRGYQDGRKSRAPYLPAQTANRLSRFH